MKYINKIGMVLAAGFMLAAASCSDYSDYNSAVDSNGFPTADKTLWQNITSDPQLSKFAKLAEKAGYAETLNSPQYFTVWAPVDSEISDEEFNKLMQKDGDAILKEFVKQHITNYSHLVTPGIDERIISLNNKHHDFTSQGFDNNVYADNGTNIPSNNGVMHKINGMTPFYPNLYENIDQLVFCDTLKNYLQAYDVEELDINASVVGPIVDGKQTYLDSVMTKHNDAIEKMLNAKFEDEDSLYAMFIPNDTAWRNAEETIKPLYQFLPSLNYMNIRSKTTAVPSSPSAANMKTFATTAKNAVAATAEPDYRCDSLVKRNIISDLVFSGTYQRNNPIFDYSVPVTAADTLYSTSRSMITSIQSLRDKTVATNSMSNGVVHVLSEYAFSPYETYNPVLEYTPDVCLNAKKISYNKSIAKTKFAGRDSLFEKVPEFIKNWILPKNSNYFTYSAVETENLNSGTAKIEFGFALRNVRSTTYRILVVTVPEQIEEEYAETEAKPYYLRFFLSYTDAENVQQATVLPVDDSMKAADQMKQEFTTDNGTSTNVLTYLGDPGKVNVIDLGEFTFPISYAGSDYEAYPSLFMSHTKSYTTSTNRAKYDQLMRVAGVYLVPKAYYDSQVSTSK